LAALTVSHGANNAPSWFGTVLARFAQALLKGGERVSMSDGMSRDLGSAARRAANSMVFLKPHAARADEAAAPANDGPAAPAPAPARAPAEQPSVISSGAEFAGSIAAPGELHVQGQIKGDVRGSTVMVCAGGRIEGDVIAETVIVHGAVRGRIFGRSVRIGAGADVVSDIRHASLGLDPAAEFEGSVKRVADPIAEAEAR
jgi:cytoskeletal protein CcmA (bactofilin family)